MRDVGYEIPPRLLDPLDFGYVVQHQHCAATWHGGGAGLEYLARNSGTGSGGANFTQSNRGLEQRKQVGSPEYFHQGSSLAAAIWHQLLHSTIGPLHFIFARNRNYRVKQTVEQALQLG